jgi:hypothetical protein
MTAIDPKWYVGSYSRQIENWLCNIYKRYLSN